MAKWDNMLAIVWLLRSRENMTASSIAERLEISIRTVYRYIDALCASGVPIVAESGHEGGYYLPESFRKAPLFFEPDELKSLFHAASFAQGSGYPYEKELARALEKINHQLNEEQRNFLKRHTTGFDVVFPQNDFSFASTLQELEQAVAEEQTVDIVYDKRRGEEPSERRVDPYGLVYRERFWYVIAYCHLRQDLRTFRVERMLSLSPSELFFKRPENFLAQEYLDQQWNNTWEAEETREPTVNVCIRGEPDNIDYLCQYFQHCLVERDGNEARFKINAERVENMLPNFLVSFGTCVRVLEPKELRIAMAEVARKLVKYYETNELP